MAAMTTNGLVALSHYHYNHLTTLFPPPLHIQKKPRKSSFRRHLLLKSSHNHSSGDEVCGPLDDIIDEITGDIWRAPPQFTFDPSFHEWHNPLKASATWTVTPLPVSRIPSEVPLTIRKQRNSRSTNSGSAFSDAMSDSQDPSQTQPDGDNRVSPSSESPDNSWPSLELASSMATADDKLESSNTTIRNEQSTSQQGIKGFFRKKRESSTSKPRSASKSRMRKLTNAFPPILRRGTSSGNKDNDTAPTNGTSTGAVSPDALRLNVTSENPAVTEDGFRSWMSRNAHRASMLGAISSELINYCPPPPSETRRNSNADSVIFDDVRPTTVKAVVKIISEIKVLSNTEQDFWVSVQIEGALHNSRILRDPSLDIIMVIDNGYYVSEDCLARAVDTAVGALNLLSEADRVSLFATHCTHEAVSGNVPELLFPLRTFSKEAKDEVEGMMLSIKRNGTQKRNPPRPNPSMTDALIAVAKSLLSRNPKHRRTHIILLSPAVSNIHGFSENYSHLYVHQISPAAIPVRTHQDPDIIMCNGWCCARFVVYNGAHSQSISGAMKQIIRCARSEKPVGALSNLHADIRARAGCQILACEGSEDIPRLRPGQVHNFFLKIRVTRSEVQGVDLEGDDQILQSCLDTNNLRQELEIAAKMGASKVRLLSVQLLYKDNLRDTDDWCYSETNMFVFKQLGKLAEPQDASSVLHKRFFFYMMSRLEIHEAEDEIQKLGEHVDSMDREVRKFIERLQKEVEYHKETVEYERTSRRLLPYCHGPIAVPASHDWIIARWNATREKEHQAKALL